MNNRNDMLRTREDVAEYMKKICKNAEKHGLYITILCGECGYISELSTVINYEIMRNQRKADTFAALFELKKKCCIGTRPANQKRPTLDSSCLKNG